MILSRFNYLKAWLIAAAFIFAFSFSSNAISGKNPERVLLRGYDLLEYLSGNIEEQSFARGYITASLDRLCVPEHINAFTLRDMVKENLLALSDTELKMSADLLVQYQFMEKWRCVNSGKRTALSALELFSDLVGSDTSNSFAGGYIAGIVDGLSRYMGCRLKSAASIDDAKEAVRVELGKRNEFAKTFPAATKAAASPSIQSSLRTAGLCDVEP